METLITVATFNDRDPADHVASRLRDSGMHAEVYDESNEQKWKLFNLHPRAHMRVRVPQNELEKANAQIAAWRGVDSVLTQSVRCPECGSSNIEFPQFSRRTLMGALPAALAATGVIAQEFYCESCHFTWPAEVKPQREVDILNWPKNSEVS